MRKILISIIIILLAVGAYFLLANGLAIGNFKINGVKDILEAGETLDSKLEQANELTTVTYNNANKNLNDALSELQTTRKQYENKIASANKDEIAKAETTTKHEIQYLWAIIGNYATSNDLKLTLDVRNTVTGVSGEKDLDFTLEGSYQGITKFLYNIEDDENLEFRIEDFKLVPIIVANNNGDQGTTSSTLQAKFSVKGVNVDLG